MKKKKYNYPVVESLQIEAMHSLCESIPGAGEDPTNPPYAPKRRDVF